MHILHINLKPDLVGGGIIFHVNKLIDEQLKNGHRVTLFYADTHYPAKKPYLKKISSPKNADFETYVLKNSPNLYPIQRGRPLNDISNPDIEREFQKLLEQVKPDIVHFHELQGLCSTCIDISLSKDYPTIFEFHNYWPLCPQIDLLDYKEENCRDFQNGRKCVICNYSPPDYYKKLYFSLKHPILTRIYKKLISKPKTSTSNTEAKNEKVKNKISENYKRRREMFVQKLNTCNGLIAISNRAKEIYVSYGIDESKVTVMQNPLFLDEGTLGELSVERKKVVETKKPLRFCYRGSYIRGKGIHVLLKAFEGIPKEKASLSVWGRGKIEDIDKFSDIGFVKSMSNISFNGEYDRKDIASIMKNVDVGIVPSIWEETFGTVGLEFLAAGIPVIASRVGGLTDYIHDGKNGFLCNPGDSGDLRNKIIQLIENPELIENLRYSIDINIKTISDLEKEMSDFYNDIIKKHS